MALHFYYAHFRGVTKKEECGLIKISISAASITINGHAGYAPYGYDIVCAAISTLTQTFLAAADELTTDTIGRLISPGKALIQHEALSREGKLLLDAFLIGVKAIANAYPDHVKLVQAVDLT